MKWGAVIRLDQRGLGVLTSEIADHLHPDRILAIREPGAERAGFAPDLTRYPEATVLTWDGALDEGECRRFLRGLDVVLVAETAYDARFCCWAREEGVRSATIAMPEFWNPDAPQPDAVWLPTSWRADLIPDARLVPVPVAVERFSPRVRSEPTFLHLVGHRAARDRAGTASLARALRYVREPFRLIVATQDRMLPAMRVPRGVKLEQRKGGTANYWDSYADASVLIAPRRYGGLSLPFGEAAAAGLALVLSDVAPNREWPGVHVRARDVGTIRTAGGEVTIHDTDPMALAAALDALAVDSGRVAELSAQSLAWAAAHSWDVLAPLWRDELERVLG